tara:strand:+ start:316 stop:591 length:276 start_codon:yes stop_codon:yes gene_type:complete
MPSFKPKANKKIDKFSSNTITVDNTHNEKMKEFEKIKYKELPELKKIRKKMLKCLKNNVSIEERILLEEKVENINKKINILKKKRKKLFIG